MREPNEAHRRRKEAVPIPGTPQIVRFRSLGSRSERDPLTPPSSPVWKAQLRAVKMPFADLPTQASAILDVTRYADTLLSLHRLSLVRTHATPQTHVAWVLLLFSDSYRLSEQRERIHRRKPFNERKRVHHLKPFQSVASAVREPL